MKEKVFLYHYCTLQTAIEYILPNRQLKLGLLQNTNDPRENKSFVFGAAWQGNPGARSTDSILQMNEQVSEILRGHCKIICFSKDSDELRGYQLSHMWAHYGGRHKGLCIALDYEKFAAENKTIFEKGYFGNVNYVSPEMLSKILIDRRYKHVNMDAYESNPDAYIKNEFRHQHREYLYFTKGIEWSYEQEARLLYFSDHDRDEFCSIRDSLAMIFVGVDFGINYLPSLKEVVGKGLAIYPLFFTGEWLGVKGDLNG